MDFKAFRNSLSKTQEDVAAEIGVSPVTISFWETGKTIPNMHSLMKMSSVFGMPIDDLAKMFERNVR